MGLGVLTVRPATEADLDGLHAIYDHYVRTSPATFDLQPTDLEQRRRWLEEHPGGPHLVLRDRP